MFIGKIRDYDGNRPGAIAKVQIDGELMLTERWVWRAIRQAERKSRRLTARYAITPVNALC